MVYEKDVEVLRLKKLAGADYRIIGNIIGVHPSAASQRCLGFSRWQDGERRQLIAELNRMIVERPCNLANQDPDLMQFLCKCKLTSPEIQQCAARSLPVSALLAAVRGGVMSYEQAAGLIRNRLSQGQK